MGDFWSWQFFSLILAILTMLWILYDILWIYFFPKFFVARKKREIVEECKEKIKKILYKCIEEYEFDSFPATLQKAEYFRTFRKYIKKQLKPGGLFNNELKNIIGKYQIFLADIFFQEISFPCVKEDMQLIDYKLFHKEREIDFALCRIQSHIIKNLPEDLLYLCQSKLLLHRQKVDSIRKAIQKDQDALCILGIEIPLKEVIEVILNSGEEFDVTGIYPKSLCFIAKDCNPEDWDIFCSLIIKASGGKIIKFLQIYSFDPTKGETVPIEFLEYTIQWLKEKKPLELLVEDWNYIEERMAKMSKIETRIDTSRVQHQDEEARKILDYLVAKYLSSYENALNYLQLNQNNLSSEEIKTQIGIKRKNLNQKLTTVSREKRKNLLVEIHFLSHDLADYLLRKGEKVTGGSK